MFSIIGTGQLGPDDLRDVLNAIYIVRSKWYFIGLELKIPYQTLDVIEAEHPKNVADCFTKMLQKWLSSAYSPTTWSSLVQALLSAPVAEVCLAEDIKKQFCSQDDQEITGQEPGVVEII